MSKMAGTKRSADSAETKAYKKPKFEKFTAVGSKKSFPADKPKYGAAATDSKDKETVLNGT